MYKLKMFKKLAKIKYLPNNFQIIEEGDHVICAITSSKRQTSTFSRWLACSFCKHAMQDTEERLTTTKTDIYNPNCITDGGQHPDWGTQIKPSNMLP